MLNCSNPNLSVCVLMVAVSMSRHPSVCWVKLPGPQFEKPCSPVTFTYGIAIDGAARFEPYGRIRFTPASFRNRGEKVWVQSTFTKSELFFRSLLRAGRGVAPTDVS